MAYIEQQNVVLPVYKVVVANVAAQICLGSAAQCGADKFASAASAKSQAAYWTSGVIDACGAYYRRAEGLLYAVNKLGYCYGRLEYGICAQTQRRVGLAQGGNAVVVYAAVEFRQARGYGRRRAGWL